MPATGGTMMTTTQATREAGSRCGRRIDRATNARWTRKNRPVHDAVSEIFSHGDRRNKVADHLGLP